MAARLFLPLARALAGLALLLAAMHAAAQAGMQESAVKAAFLYKFASFVEWPAGTFTRPDQPLVIGVSGDDEVAAELEKIVAGRVAEGHPVQARRIAEGAPAQGVHVLYLGNRREARLRDAIEAAPGPVLVVTAQPGALRLGSVLNFVEDRGRIRFAASIASAEARNLRLSARLLAVAQNIEGRNR